MHFFDVDSWHLVSERKGEGWILEFLPAVSANALLHHYFDDQDYGRFLFDLVLEFLSSQWKASSSQSADDVKRTGKEISKRKEEKVRRRKKARKCLVVCDDQRMTNCNHWEFLHTRQFEGRQFEGRHEEKLTSCVWLSRWSTRLLTPTCNVLVREDVLTHSRNSISSRHLPFQNFGKLCPKNKLFSSFHTCTFSRWWKGSTTFTIFTELLSINLPDAESMFPPVSNKTVSRSIIEIDQEWHENRWMMSYQKKE